ncbi:MAG TPA: hypothetical protein VIW73_04390 [Candidatus Cybelea sp.]
MRAAVDGATAGAPHAEHIASASSAPAHLTRPAVFIHILQEATHCPGCRLAFAWRSQKPRRLERAVARSCRRRKKHCEARIVITASGASFWMPTFNNHVLTLTAGALFATSACGGHTTVPFASQVSAPGASSIVPDDTHSILKKLTKDVKIGSTVDPKNGDMGPRAISVARSTFGLKKGQLVVCNFDDSAGTAGKGTTIEVLDPHPHSKLRTFAQSSKVGGCVGDATTATNYVYGAGLSSDRVSKFDPTGSLKKSYGSPVQVPFADADAFCGLPYAPEDIYIADSKTGSIIKLAFIPVSRSGHAKLTQVMTGFGVNKGSGWGVLGPSGVQYNSTRIGNLCNDTLYIVDGVNNTVIAVSTASNLLAKDEIIVLPGGKRFKCAHPKATCARLVYSGSPLNAPVASALLPNGNLIVANTKGGNTLVELTPTGKVLATKIIDTSTTAHVFGLLATGTTDSDTALFYTDTETNTLHELEQ